MSSRLEFSQRTRMATFLRADGKCENCAVKLTAATGLEYDHIIPAALGGDNSETNCQCLCRNCHSAKTNGDKPGGNKDIAKGKRIARRYAKAERKGRSIPGSRDSKWKKKIDGTVVPR